MKEEKTAYQITRADRQGIKKKARKVVKSHYLLLVVLCLIAVMYGTEFSYVKDMTDGLHALITGQEVENGDKDVTLSNVTGGKKVYEDLTKNDLEAGKEDADKQMQEYEEGELGGIVGRQRGNLAPIVNVVSSGRLYVILVEGLRTIFDSSSSVATGIFIVLSMILSAFVWIFIKNMYQVVLRRAFLESRLYEKLPVGHLLHFKTAKRWKRTAMTLFLTEVFYVLWSFTIVGGIIKRYSYFLVPYIAAENPDIKPREAINLSRRMMNGHKWECFKIEFSFIGWMLLGFATFGGVELFYGLPYRIATFTEYYSVLRERAKAEGVEGTERLNDIYLFEKAEESFLRASYPDVEEQKKYIDEHRITLTGVHGWLVRNMGLWIGHTDQLADYEDLDSRRVQIAEERAAIKGRVYPQRLNPLMDANATLEIRKLRYVRPYTIWSLILAFIFFSFVGWLWEVSLHLIKDGVFVNRGVFHGPWLPIYGGGLVMILIVLARFRKKPQVEIALIVVLCGIVEYFTSLFLELSAGMRWWDYTGYFLNLNGRICAEGLLVFALGGAAVVYLAMPLL
ncbi:MAG: DUF975 family protein, partial [Lachnospiraceae bacterium]|nr:DUF975 family protein [Lachnospiraceae bacterium]